MIAFPLPLAAGDWVGLVIFLVVMLISVVGQVFNKLKENVQRPPPRPLPPPDRDPGPPLGDPLTTEIEDFLNRAKRRPGQLRPQQPPPPPPPRPGNFRPVYGSADVPLEIEVIDEKAESVAEHVRTHVGGSNFGQVGSRSLGSEVAKSDDRLAAHLHQVFDHQLGTLAGSPGMSTEIPAIVEPDNPSDRLVEEPPPIVANLVAMLASPVGVQQAVLLAEVLNRPEQRWS